MCCANVVPNILEEAKLENFSCKGLEIDIFFSHSMPG